MDIRVWVERKEDSGEKEVTVIHHITFKNKEATPLVFHIKGAHSWQSKIVTLSEELRRRYSNTNRCYREIKFWW